MPRTGDRVRDLASLHGIRQVAGDTRPRRRQDRRRRLRDVLLICSELCQAEGEAPVSARGGASLLAQFAFSVSVSLATHGQTDLRGLVTAGRCFGWERVRASRDRASPLGTSWKSWGLLIESLAGRSSRCHRSRLRKQDQDVSIGRPVGRRGRPVTSTSRPARGRWRRWRRCGFLRRVRICTHRWCRRRLPWSPRSRAAAGANAHRSRMVLPIRYRGWWCQAASTRSRRT